MAVGWKYMRDTLLPGLKNAAGKYPTTDAEWRALEEDEKHFKKQEAERRREWSRRRRETTTKTMHRFRPQRGGLHEALAEMVSVRGLSGLEKHLGVAKGGLRIAPYGGDDSRIGWVDVHIVMRRYKDHPNSKPYWAACGFVEGRPK